MNDFFERTIIELNNKCTILGAKVQEAINDFSVLKSEYTGLKESFKSLQEEYENLLSLVINKS